MEHLCPQLGQVVDVHHDRVAGKDRCGEEGVGRRIGVGGGVVEDDDLVIAVHDQQRGAGRVGQSWGVDVFGFIGCG